MNVTCNMVDGMSQRDKESYFNHMEKRHAEEKAKVEEAREELQNYKQMLIGMILEMASDRFTYEELKKKTTNTLERIYDYC